jgi:two-component system NarL family response regulator
MEPASIRVLIVEDHPIVRYGLVALIDSQQDMKVVGQSGDGEEAVSMYRQVRPDVGIVDLRLPRMSGVEVIRAVRRFDRKARLVVLTTYDGDEDIHRAIASGAEGYLIKAMSHETLLGAIRKIHAGGQFIPEVIAKTLATRVSGDELTPREIEILCLIVQGKSNKDIAACSQITEGTVKCHVNVILDKLGASHRTQAAAIALQRGFVHL